MSLTAAQFEGVFIQDSFYSKQNNDAFDGYKDAAAKDTFNKTNTAYVANQQQSNAVSTNKAYLLFEKRNLLGNTNTRPIPQNHIQTVFNRIESRLKREKVHAQRSKYVSGSADRNSMYGFSEYRVPNSTRRSYGSSLGTGKKYWERNIRTAGHVYNPLPQHSHNLEKNDIEKQEEPEEKSAEKKEQNFQNIEEDGVNQIKTFDNINPLCMQKDFRNSANSIHSIPSVGNSLHYSPLKESNYTNLGNSSFNFTNFPSKPAFEPAGDMAAQEINLTSGNCTEDSKSGQLRMLSRIGKVCTRIQKPTSCKIKRMVRARNFIFNESLPTDLFEKTQELREINKSKDAQNIPQSFQPSQTGQQDTEDSQVRKEIVIKERRKNQRHYF